MMDSNIVKLYGLNHSGSHYLAWLLHNNFQNMVVLHSHTGWNHGKIVTEFDWNAENWNTDPYLNVDKKDHAQLLMAEELNSGKVITHYKEQIKKLYENQSLPLLVLIRNPYDWLRSYNIKHNPLLVPWKNLQQSCRLWSDTNQNYMETEWLKKHIIKYENLRDKTETELENISEFLNIQRNNLFRDTVADAVVLSQIDYQTPYENNGGKERCMMQHEKVFNISEQEFNKIFEENIDPKVLDFYNNL